MFLGAVQFSVFLVVSESEYPGYSASRQPLSDLGATCSSKPCYIPPSATLFDSTVFMLGALVFVAAFLVYIGRSRSVGGLLALSSWGAMGVAIFPETTGIVHTLVSLITFLFGGLAAIWSFKVAKPPLGYFSVALGIMGLVALVLYATGTYLGLGQGGMERMIVFPELLWLAALSVSFMTDTERERIPAPTPL